MPASKFNYRCRECPILNEANPNNEKFDVIYTPTMFGNKFNGMRFYEEYVGYSSASNVCYIDDRLLELCASSNHPTWASLEGFSETMNEYFRNCKVTKVNVERTKEFFSHVKMEKEDADMDDVDNVVWCTWHELSAKQLRYGKLISAELYKLNKNCASQLYNKGAVLQFSLFVNLFVNRNIYTTLCF